MADENPIFLSPEAMKDAIGKEVAITTLNGIQHNGFIYAIDPITKSVVLTDSTGKKLDLLLYHAIKTIILGENIDERFILKLPSTIETELFEEKKQNLAKWLRENCIEVIEDGVSLKISDYVTIEPPYDLDHCYCTNTIVLERLQNIIKRMPV